MGKASAVAPIFCLASVARSLALYGTAQALPGNLSGNIVGLVVTDDTAVKKKLGTGTVLDVHGDAKGKGGWVCILTADHVSYNADAIEVDFTNKLEVEVSGQGLIVYQGPVSGKFRADISVVKVHVDDVTKLPKVDPITFAKPKVGDGVILAGMGWKFKAFYGPNAATRQGYVVTSDFGTLRSGTDTLDAIDKAITWTQSHAKGDRRYQFSAIEGSLTYAAGKGDAYVVDQDSGGPTFSASNLVGVHSRSDVGGLYANGDEAIPFGSKWDDVQAESYKEWIKGRCEAPVPEPSVALGLAAGTALMLLSRLRFRQRHQSRQ